MKKIPLVVFVIVAACVATYFYVAKVGVTVTADESDDMCGAYARVKGKPDEEIALKSRPSSFSRTLANISNGAGLLLCEEDNGWHGVIVIEGQDDCLDRDNRNVPRHYGGPCISGWLPGSQVELIAG